MVGVVSLVAMVGPPVRVTAGAEVSTVSTWVAVPVFWEGSVTEATTVCGPVLRASALSVQTPSTAVPVSTCDPMVTVTTGLPGSSVVPDTDGVVSLVDRAEPPSMATTGATRSSMGLTMGLLDRAMVLGVRARPLSDAPSPKEMTPAPSSVPTNLTLAPKATAPTTCQ